MRKVASIATLYLALFGALLYAWIAQRAGAVSTVPVGTALVCAAPALLCVLVLALHRGEPSQYLAKSVACIGMLPILLLMWGVDQSATSAQVAPAGTADVTAPQARELDAERLFAGAIAVQNAPVMQPPLLELRSGMFADGSELQLMRLASSRHAAAQLRFLADAQRGSASQLGARDGVRLSPGGAGTVLVHLEQHGPDLLQVSAKDEATALARLEAQHVAVPDTVPAAAPELVDSAAVATEPALRVWPIALAFGVGHMLCFTLFIVWAAVATTRLSPAPHASVTTDDLLRARLQTLPATGLRCAVSLGERPCELVIDYVYGGSEPRSHRVLLELDVARRIAFVRERSGAAGAAPRDADEADMRPLGSVGIDPTVPRAQKVYSTTRYASFVDPARLAAVPLAFDGARVTLPPDFAAAVDERELATVVAALVTRAGWTFQPILFDFQRGA